MVGPFDQAVFSCPLLKPYGPVKTKFGYHIIKVLYRRWRVILWRPDLSQLTQGAIMAKTAAALHIW